MSDPIVGIDLGTSNSAVARADETGTVQVLADDASYKIHPSVVSFHPNGGVIVGAPAKQRKVIDPANTVYSSKRLIGRTFESHEVQTAKSRMPYLIKEGASHMPMIVTRGGEFAVPEISAIILDYLKNIATQRLNTEVRRAVITVPASFNDAQRSATATAGAVAGLSVVRVLNEPTAAALAYGHTRGLHQVIAVYDFGGGTFDVTILRVEDEVYEVLGTAGDNFLGGDDLDERLVDRMIEKFLKETRIDLRNNEISMMRLRAVAEQTKIELSRRARAVVRVDEIAYGPKGVALNLQIELTRDELVTQIQPLVDRTFPVCDEALALAGIGTDAIADVILVGGTTKIPYVRDQVSRFFNRAPRTDIAPEEAVALGAALQAASLERVVTRKRRSSSISAIRPVTFGDTTMDEPAITVVPTDDVPRRTSAERPGSYSVTRAGTRDDFATDSQADRQAIPLARVSRAPTQPTSLAKSRFGIPQALRGNTDSDAYELEPSQVTVMPQGRTTEPTSVPPPPRVTMPASVPPPPRVTQTQVVPVVPPAARAAPAVMAMRPPVLGVDVSGPLDLELAEEVSGFTMPGTTGVIAPAPATPASTVKAPQAHPINVAAAALPSPVVLDVTPRGLGIGTVAGFCEELIRRNSRLPTEARKLFTTSRDKQDVVRIVICQGDSRRLESNTVIGDLKLENLPPRPRGETSIEVTFALDASGILQVRARDPLTGNEQSATLDLVGSMSEAEVSASRERLQSLLR